METKIIADSSFYVCFMDTLKDTSFLDTIVSKFHIQLSPLVHKEISKSKNFEPFYSKNKARINVFEEPVFEIGELLKPFFSKDQKLKGEHEILAVAYFCHNFGLDYVLIIDEEGPRAFLKDNMSVMEPKLTGTVGFIGSSYYLYDLITGEHALSLLDKIDKSTFRVSRKIISLIRDKIITQMESGK